MKGLKLKWNELESVWLGLDGKISINWKNLLTCVADKNNNIYYQLTAEKLKCVVMKFLPQNWG